MNEQKRVELLLVILSELDLLLRSSSRLLVDDMKVVRVLVVVSVVSVFLRVRAAKVESRRENRVLNIVIAINITIG